MIIYNVEFLKIFHKWHISHASQESAQFFSLYLPYVYRLGFLHAQTLVNKPDGELSIYAWVGRSRGYTITKGITRGLLFCFCYDSLPERGHITDFSWVHSVLLLRTWKAVTGRHHQAPCPRKIWECPELLPEPVAGHRGGCNTTRGSQGMAKAAPAGSHSRQGSTHQVGAIQTPWNQRLSPLAGLTQPSTLGDSLESSHIKMSNKELLQKHPSSVCDNQSTPSGTYYLISLSGEGTKTPSCGSQPRQEYLYLTNLCYLQQITLETCHLLQKSRVPEKHRFHQRRRESYRQTKEICSVDVLPIPFPNVSLALHSSMD